LDRKKLTPFIKFWNNSDAYKDFREVQIATTSNPILKGLQIFIFETSSYIHTLVDLQGGMQGEYIILTDIEFTDTIQKLGWKQDVLLRAFRKVYQIGDRYVYKEEFSALKDDLNSVKKAVDEINNKLNRDLMPGMESFSNLVPGIQLLSQLAPGLQAMISYIERTQESQVETEKEKHTRGTFTNGAK